MIFWIVLGLLKIHYWAKIGSFYRVVTKCSCIHGVYTVLFWSKTTSNDVLYLYNNKYHHCVSYLRVWESFGWLSRFEVPLTLLTTSLFAGYSPSEIDSIMFGGVNMKFDPQKGLIGPINQLNISRTNITWCIGVKKELKSQAGWSGGPQEPSKMALSRLWKVSRWAKTNPKHSKKISNIYITYNLYKTNIFIYIYMYIFVISLFLGCSRVFQDCGLGKTMRVK